MKATLEGVEMLVRQARVVELTDLLLSLSPTERDEMRPGIRKMLRKARRDESFPTPIEANKTSWWWRQRVFQAARLAALATFELSELIKLQWTDSGDPQFWLPSWGPWRVQMLRILEELKPPWLQEFADFLLVQNLDHWFFVRALIRRGHCKPSKTHQYTFGMASELRRRWSIPDPDEKFESPPRGFEDLFREEPKSVEDVLRNDPELLKEDIWTLFDYEGDSRCSLAALESLTDPGDGWRDTLVKLGNDGLLSRARLLDRCLEAIARDYKPYYASWFLGFHRALKPTVDEIGKRHERYHHMLGSANPATVKLGLENLSVLQKAKRFDSEKFVDAVEPAFRLSAKATVKQALKLLEFAINGNRSLAVRAGEIAALALLNEAADVQAAVFDFFERHFEAQPDLTPYRESISPSNQSRFQKIYGMRNPAPKPVIHETADQTEALTPATIKPIESLDELLDRASYGLENPEDVLELERVLDGVSRLCHLRRSDMPQYAAALLQKCMKVADLTSSASWMFPVESLANLLRNWILDEATLADGLPDAPTYNAFLVRRIVPVHVNVMYGVGMPLFGAPTNADGWIESSTLVERARVWLNSKFHLAIAEVVTALLRIAPEGRKDALALAKHLPGEIGGAIRYVLGDDSVEIGPTAPIWIAAARARHPGEDDPKVNAVHPECGPDAALVAHYSWEIYPTGYTKFPPYERIRITRTPAPPRTNTADFFSVLPCDAFSDYSETFLYFYPRDEVSWRWATLIWPGGSESFLANGACLLANYSLTTAKEFFKVVRAQFEIFHRTGTAMGPMAWIFLAFACVAKSSEIRSLGTDAIIRLITARKFDTQGIALPLVKLSRSKSFFYGGRLSTVLSEVARQGGAHTKAVAALLDDFLAAMPASDSRDAPKILEVLVEASIASDHKLSAGANRFLKTIPSTPKVTQLVKRLS